MRKHESTVISLLIYVHFIIADNRKCHKITLETNQPQEGSANVAAKAVLLLFFIIHKMDIK